MPAEYTRIGERGLSLALSAYSAVMLRRMLPVHTNKMDGMVVTNLPSTRSLMKNRRHRFRSDRLGGAGRPPQRVTVIG
jgi:hypothetical protein